MRTISPGEIALTSFPCAPLDLGVADVISLLVKRENTAYGIANALRLPLSTAYAKARRAIQHGLVEVQGRKLQVTVRGLIYCLCNNCEERRLVVEKIMQKFELKTRPAYVEAYIYMLLKALNALSIPLEKAPVERLCSSATLMLAVLKKAPLTELQRFLQIDPKIFNAAMPVLAEGLARLGLAVDLGAHYYFPSFGLVVCKSPCDKEGRCTLRDEITRLKKKIGISLGRSA